MGIYPKTEVVDRVRNADGTETWTEVYNAFDGAIRTRRITAEPYTVTWETCYCCSCGDWGSDPACRNHGFAATRPCDIHDTPGSEWDPDDFEGQEPRGGWMPEPVSVERARSRA